MSVFWFTCLLVVQTCGTCSSEPNEADRTIPHGSLLGTVITSVWDQWKCGFLGLLKQISVLYHLEQSPLFFLPFTLPASLARGMVVWVHFVHLSWMTSWEEHSVPLWWDLWDNLMFDGAEKKDPQMTQMERKCWFPLLLPSRMETGNILLLLLGFLAKMKCGNNEQVALGRPCAILTGTFQIQKCFSGLHWVCKNTEHLIPSGQ